MALTSSPLSRQSLHQKMGHISQGLTEMLGDEIQSKISNTVETIECIQAEVENILHLNPHPFSFAQYVKQSSICYGQEEEVYEQVLNRLLGENESIHAHLQILEKGSPDIMIKLKKWLLDNFACEMMKPEEGNIPKSKIIRDGEGYRYWRGNKEVFFQSIGDAKILELQGDIEKYDDISLQSITNNISQLRGLFIHSYDIDERVYTAFLSQTPKLKILNLMNSNYIVGFLPKIMNMISVFLGELRVLDLSGIALHDLNMEHLSGLKGGFQKVQYLDVSHSLTKMNNETLLEFLGLFPHLCVLNLAGNKLYNRPISFWKQLAEQVPTVKQWGFCNNSLGMMTPSDFQSLMTFFEHAGYIDLSNNELSKIPERKLIETLSPFVRQEKVNLENNKISSFRDQMRKA